MSDFAPIKEVHVRVASWACSVAALVIVPIIAAHANDSAAEIGVGGLVLTRNDAIRLDTEDLSVSRDRVNVTYRFTNTSDRDVEVLVAFPLPDQTFGVEIPAIDFAERLAFRTTVDGSAVPLDVVVRATFGGQDITQRLAGLGLPSIPARDLFARLVNAMPEQQRRALVAEGLIVEDGSDSVQALWAAKWTLATTVTRRQTFPAGRSVRVEHTYVPYTGGSIGGYLDPEYRTQADFAAHRRRYCIDDGFVAGLDRRMRNGQAADSGLRYAEVWLSYVLTSGANWAGPIGQFRLVVDKGDANSLVSFCGEGVRKLDQTRFELTKRNFVPKSNLDVLIVDFHRD
jgi:hypothetical protein